MPRIARKDYNTSFFHIMVQGINKEHIFNKDHYKEKYMDFMYKYLEKYDVKIIAYCIMSNHAHLLVYVEKISELSEYMRSINTTYALYYNKILKRVGYVFRNRYQVEPIYNDRYLINCIHYIHDNPIKAQICKTMEQYKYSSYYEYKFHKEKIIKKSLERFKDVTLLYIDSIFTQKEIDYTYMDYEEDKEILSKEEIIEKFLKNKNIKKNEIKTNSEYLHSIAIELNKKCRLTHQEIANEFGVNRMKITRLINKKCSK